MLTETFHNLTMKSVLMEFSVGVSTHTFGDLLFLLCSGSTEASLSNSTVCAGLSGPLGPHRAPRSLLQFWAQSSPALCRLRDVEWPGP